jgi:hypothetical protein
MKWTYEARELLYSQLVARFGPHKDWETSARPGRGLNEEYDLFCENFAKTIRSKSGNAVKHQISFALPIPEGGTRYWAQGHARSAILNLAAAFQAGFVEAFAFPSLIATPGNVPPVNFSAEPHNISERSREYQEGINDGDEDE